jgi:hypothetical protein
MKPPVPERCELCHREKTLTFHHLIPKKTHRKRRIRYRYHRDELHHRGLWVCRLCHRQLHRFFSEEQLAEDLNTRDRILEEPAMVRFLAWARRQR